jgi:hypothetical protein
MQHFTYDTTLSLAKDVGGDMGDDSDLELIHQFADESTTLADFAIVRMTAITSDPVVKDGLRLIVSHEWQQAHIGNYEGLPLMSDHSSSRDKSLGRIFAATLTTNDGVTSTEIKAFIPKIADNENSIDRIRLGQDRDVSLGFRFSKFDEVELDGIPHIKILPSGESTDGPREVSLVGVPACQQCGITSIAASADKPIEEILHEPTLSPNDKECLLFGRMMQSTLIGDVASYERQLGLVTDVKLAQDSYQHLSPFHLQDRRDTLLNTLKRNEKTDTQCSVDVEAMLSESFGKERIPDTEDDKTLRIKQILESIRSN